MFVGRAAFDQVCMHSLIISENDKSSATHKLGKKAKSSKAKKTKNSKATNTAMPSGSKIAIFWFFFMRSLKSSFEFFSLKNPKALPEESKRIPPRPKKLPGSKDASTYRCTHSKWFVSTVLGAFV